MEKDKVLPPVLNYNKLDILSAGSFSELMKFEKYGVVFYDYFMAVY